MKKLEDLTKEEFEGLKKCGMFWEVYPDATSELWGDQIQANPIYQRVREQEKIISDAYSEIEQIKKDCAHPLQYFEVENNSHSDEWGSNTTYWRTCRCSLCGIGWSHEFYEPNTPEEMREFLLES
jgi:hypothetical protein